MKNDYPKFLKRLLASNLILFFGFLLSQTNILPQITMTRNIHFVSWMEDGLLYGCTLIQITAFLMYLFLKPFQYFTAIFQFIILPISSTLFLKQGSFQDNLMINSLRIIFFLIGWIICLIMVVTQYKKISQQETQNIMKISIKFRICKLIKLFGFVILVAFNISEDMKMNFNFLFAMSIIQFLIFLTTFTFQNPFHEYLIMISTISSILSFLDLVFYNYGFSNYSYIGECFFILIFVFEPQIFKRFLEFKYQIYGQSNIQTKSFNQILAFFVVLKQIILMQQKTFDYSPSFDKSTHIIFQKMIKKCKVSTQTIYRKSEFLKQNILSEDQLNFLKLMQRKFKDSHQFTTIQFFLTTIIRQTYNYEGKALITYYNIKKQKSLSQNNIFNKIQMTLLYKNLTKMIIKDNLSSESQQVLNFSQSLQQLRSKMVQSCKKELTLMNLIQNNSRHIPCELYKEELIKRHQLKRQISCSIDQLNQNPYHLHSGNFLYLVLLFKIIFQRQKKIIQEKLLVNFIIPLTFWNKKSKVQLDTRKDISTIVISNKQKGLILNENQLFSKNYGKSVKSNPKSKKYISDLFPSLKQKITHQQLMQVSTKYDSQQVKIHGQYQCYINKKIIVNDNSKIHEDQNNISMIQKVKISTKLYYQIQEEECFICTIQNLNDDGSVKVLKNQFQILKKKNCDFQTISTLNVNQLGQTFQVYQIQVNNATDSFYSSDSQQYENEVNISQNFLTTFNIQSGEHYKLEKIEKQYDKQKVKFNYRKLYSLLILIFPLLIILSNILCGSFKQEKLQILDSYLNIEEIMFKNTLLTQKLIGLELIVHRMVLAEFIPKNMCQQFNITDLKQFIGKDLQNFALQSFDQIETVDIKDQTQNSQISNLLQQKLYLFFGMQDSNLMMDYKKYTAMSKSFVYEHISVEDKDTDAEEEKIWLDQSIKKAITLSELLDKKLFCNINIFIKSASESINQTLNYSVVIFCSTSFILFLCTLYVFYCISSYNYCHVWLIKDFKKSFIQGRNRQMDYILDQLSKIEKNQISEVQLTKNLSIIIIDNNKDKIIDLSQFQKQSYLKISKNGDESSSKSASVLSSSQLQEQKQQFLQSQENIENLNSKVSNTKLIIVNKFKIAIIFLLYISLIAIHVINNELLRQRSSQKLQYSESLVQMGNLMTQTNNLLIGEWIKFSKQQTYSTYEQNIQRISNALKNLNANPYKQNIFKLFPREVSDKILYSSYCSQSYNTSICQKIKAGALIDGLVPLVSSLQNDYKSTWENKLSLNNIQLQKNQICQKLIVFVSFTIHQFGNTILSGYSKIQDKRFQRENQILIGEIIISVLMLLFIGYFAYQMVKIGEMIRAEVLSMDSKINIYQNQQLYRPFLNELFYRENED